MTERDVEAAFEEGPALVPYVVAGDPDLESTERYVEALVRGGADVIELGLPFSEPIADGPTIQEAINRALDAGVTPERYLEFVADLDVGVPIVCMTYYNLIYRYGADESSGPSSGEASPGEGDTRADGRGVEAFVAAAADAGISGLIVPDLPVEEADALEAACDRHDLALVFIVAPTTTEERARRLLDRASGFLYVQARLGTTGAREDVSEDTHASLGRLRDADVPTAVGFGVSEREHAREIVAGGADGVVAGSVFVELIAEADDPAARLEEKARELKSGAEEGLSRPERT